MKLSIIATAVLLFGVNSMACDAFFGSWQCTDSEGVASVDTYSKVSGGMSFSSVEADGTKNPEIIADGKSHVLDVVGMKMNYIATISCNGNSARTSMNYQSSAVTDDGYALDLKGSSNGTMSRSGNTLNIESSDSQEISHEGEVVHKEVSPSLRVVCTKI